MQKQIFEEVTKTYIFIGATPAMMVSVEAVSK